TGASGGIGAELARVLAAHGHDLVLVARGSVAIGELGRELEQRHGVAVRVVPADLSQPGAAERLWADVTVAPGTVDVLVNNAGAGLHGPHAELDPGDLNRMLELNVTALAALTRLALPGMLQRRRGRILN